MLKSSKNVEVILHIELSLRDLRDIYYALSSKNINPDSIPEIIKQIEEIIVPLDGVNL